MSEAPSENAPHVVTPRVSRASLFHGAEHPLTFEKLPIPELRDGEMLARIVCSTLCGSDLHTLNGLRKEPVPTILGHEAIGEIVALKGQLSASDGSLLNIGDQIAWSVCVSCGKCSRCQNRIPQKCLSLAKYGHLKANGRLALSGGFADYILLRPGSAICHVPAEIPAEVASIANCAVATIMGAFRIAGSPQARSVLVIGAGMLGLTAAAYADLHGARSVTVVDREPARLKTSGEFGASRSALDVTELSSAGAKFDIVIEATGSPVAVEQAIKTVDIGGTVVLVGSVMPSPAVAFDPESLVRRCASIHGLHNYVVEDLNAAFRFLQTAIKRYPFASVIQQRFSLAELPQAIEFAKKFHPLRVAIFPNGEK